MKQDPLMEKLRKSHPLKGPDPKGDLNKWAAKYCADISAKCAAVHGLKRRGCSLEDICEKTGLYAESVEAILSKKK